MTFPQPIYPCYVASGGSFPPGSPALWYDFSNAGSVTLSGSNITSIADLSGNSNTGTTSALGTKPTQGTVNSLNTCLFDSSQSQYIGLTNSISYTDCTVAFVAKKVSSSNKFIAVSDRITFLYSLNWHSDSVIYAHSTSGFDFTTGTQTDTTNAHVLVGTQSGGTTFAIRFDASNQTLNGYTAGSVTGSWGCIGSDGNGANFSNGHLCEILFYTSVLNGTDISAIEAHLKSKWGTP